MRRHSLVVVVIAAGCVEGEARLALTQVSDSAGVRVVTTHADLLDSVPLYSVPHNAVFELGGSEVATDVLYQVAAARFLPDGRLVVLHGGHELRYFDSSGQLTGTFGGDGDGPGEYRIAYGLIRSSEGGVAVWDAGLARLSFLGSAGAFERSQGLDLDRFAEVFPTALQLQPESRWLLLDEHRLLVFAYSFSGLPDEGPGRPAVHYVTFSLDGERVDTLGLYGGIEQTRLTGPVPAAVMTLDPDDTHAVADPGAGYLYVADGGENHIDRYDASGSLDLRIIVDGMVRTPVRHVVVDARVRLAEQMERRGVMLSEGALDAIEQGDGAPTFRGLALGDDGALWVEWGQQASAAMTRYVIFDSEGAPTGVVDLPANAAILDVMGRRIALLHRSPLDVETVAVYELPERRAPE